jgi:hypothetical protein
MEPGLGPAPVIEPVQIIELLPGRQGGFNGFHQPVRRQSRIQHHIRTRAQKIGMGVGGFPVIQNNGDGFFRQIVQDSDTGIHGPGNQGPADKKHIGTASHQVLPGVVGVMKHRQPDIRLGQPLFNGSSQFFFFDGTHKPGQHRKNLLSTYIVVNEYRISYHCFIPISEKIQHFTQKIQKKPGFRPLDKDLLMTCPHLDLQNFQYQTAEIVFVVKKYRNLILSWKNKIL